MIAHPILFAVVALATTAAGFFLGLWYAHPWKASPTTARRRVDPNATLDGVQVDELLRQCRKGDAP